MATKRVTKRRVETRKRLLAAAYDVFAEEGFGRATVEQICDRAGYTRGAFYSNFASLDELFLAIWEQKSSELLDDVRSAVNDIDTAAQVLDQIVRLIPVDDRWYRITAEFTAHALRNPALRRVMAARERAILDTLLPLLEPQLDRLGRHVPDPDALGQALVAVHDGTTVQCLMEPDDPAVFERRVELFTRVVMTYTEEKQP